MQGKLRLKAHKLWSHLVCQFEETAPKFPASFCSKRSSSLKKYMHQFLN